MGVQDNFGSIFLYRIEIEVPEFQRWCLGFRSLDCRGSRRVYGAEQARAKDEHIGRSIYMCARVGWKEGWCVCSKMVFWSGLVGQDLNISE